MTTTRIRPGLYETTTGHLIEAAEDENGRRYGWHLLTPSREWVQTFTTKAAALEGLTEILEENYREAVNAEAAERAAAL